MMSDIPSERSRQPHAPRWHDEHSPESTSRLRTDAHASHVPVTVKPHTTITQQLLILHRRGMSFGDMDGAYKFLEDNNYFRISHYWLSMLEKDAPGGSDSEGASAVDERAAGEGAADEGAAGKGAPTEPHFVPGADFGLVMDLYSFDRDLQHTLMEELIPIELKLRALIGFHFGAIDPFLHVHPNRLNLSTEKNRQIYHQWHAKYQKALRDSDDQYIIEHSRCHGGNDLPIWAAVEVMTWADLRNLYMLAPKKIRATVSVPFGLKHKQLASWLGCLTKLRNYVCHNHKLFDRTFPRQPSVGSRGDLAHIAQAGPMLFGQLSMVQYIHRHLDLSPAIVLPQLLATYPDNEFVPLSAMGVPEDWQSLPDWAV